MPVLLTGGARSGKSATAAARADRLGAPVTVIATAEAGDDEMAARIARHQADRPAGWTVIEAPIDLCEAVGAAGDETVIVDCLALWVTNSLDQTDEAILDSARSLAAQLSERAGETIVVTNEVGDGIVPANAVARRFRDVLGSVNQIVAQAADRSFLCVSGQLLELSTADTLDV